MEWLLWILAGLVALLTLAVGTCLYQRWSWRPGIDDHKTITVPGPTPPGGDPLHERTEIFLRRRVPDTNLKRTWCGGWKR